MNTIQKRSLHQLYSRPILFVGLLLLLAGAWCYTQMQTNLFPGSVVPPYHGDSRCRTAARRSYDDYRHQTLGKRGEESAGYDGR